MRATASAQAILLAPPRRWFVDTIALLIGGTLLAFGVILVVNATTTRNEAQARERAAKNSATTVRSYVSAAFARKDDLAARLRANQTRLKDLQRARATKFSSTIKIGQDRGTRAGMAAGKTAGTLAARAQRSSIAKSGWYYVQITWSNGMPSITNASTLIPGATRAYFIESGAARRRDTTTR